MSRSVGSRMRALLARFRASRTSILPARGEVWAPTDRDLLFVLLGVVYNEVRWHAMPWAHGLILWGVGGLLSIGVAALLRRIFRARDAWFERRRTRRA